MTNIKICAQSGNSVCSGHGGDVRDILRYYRGGILGVYLFAFGISYKSDVNTVVALE